MITIIFSLICIGMIYSLMMHFEGLNLFIRYFLVWSIILFYIIVYSFSLNHVKITNNHIILSKNIGYIRLSHDEIESISKIKFVNLPTTISSRGVFGYNSQFMDQSLGLINNRKNIIRIECTNKNYIISLNQPLEFIAEFERIKKNN